MHELKWALKHKCPATVEMFLSAAHNGHVKCLQTVHSVFSEAAALRGQSLMECLLNVSSAQVRVSDIIAVACKAKQWSCVEFLLREGYLADTTCTFQLLTAGQLELYQIALDVGYRISSQVGVHFAAIGDVVELKNAFDHGCPRSELNS